MARAKIKKIVAGFLGALLLSSCATSNIPSAPQSSEPTPPAQSESDRFAEFTRRLFVERVSESGINLQYELVNPAAYGIPADAGTSLGDYTLEGILEYEKLVHTEQAELKAFDRAALTEAQQMTYDILDYIYNLELTSEGMGLYVEFNNSRNGVLFSMPRLLSDYRIENEQDVKRYLALVEDIPRIYQESLAFAKLQAEAGLFMPSLVLDKVLAGGKTLLEKPEESVLLASFDERIELLSELDTAAKQAYVEHNRKLFIDQVVPESQALLDGLEALRPFSREPLGLMHTGEKGKDFYAYMVRSWTSWEAPIEDLIALLDEEIVKSLRIIALGQMSSQDFFSQAFDYYEKAIELGTEQEMLINLKELAKADYPPLADVDYEIKYIPESLQKSSAPAYYLTPPSDEPTRNLIYINPDDLEDGLPQELFNILAHEGYPGHLYQSNYFRQQNPDSIRNQLGFRAYSEGWADYVDERALSWVGLNDRAAQVLRHAQRYDVLITARIDLGIHYEGWTREKTAEYLEGFGLSDIELTNSVYDSSLEDPANMLPYIVGMLEFDAMRLDTQKKLGDNFDIMAFHKAVLDCGPAPFSIVRREVEKYVASVMPAEEAPATSSEAKKAA